MDKHSATRPYLDEVAPPVTVAVAKSLTADFNRAQNREHLWVICGGDADLRRSERGAST
jgi:hypothetical protein